MRVEGQVVKVPWLLGKGAGLCLRTCEVLQLVLVAEPLGDPVLRVKRSVILPCEHDTLHVHGIKSPLWAHTCPVNRVIGCF